MELNGDEWWLDEQVQIELCAELEEEPYGWDGSQMMSPADKTFLREQNDWRTNGF